MIEAITITGIKLEIDDTTRKYVTKKIERLDRYLPKHARKSVTAEVKLETVNKDHGNKYEAEVLLHVPDALIVAKESTVNVLAAIDIVEAKLVAQLHHYKETSVAHIGKRGVLSRLKHRDDTIA